MAKGILIFDNIEIFLKSFYRHKIPILLGDVDIEKVLVSNKIRFVEKASINIKK